MGMVGWFGLSKLSLVVGGMWSNWLVHVARNSLYSLYSLYSFLKFEYLKLKTKF